jgi:chemotaxis protein methyltransferase CheR
MAISEELKRRIVFQQHDLLKDPYQTGFDLILCRNVFIYFTSETQKRLTARFVQSLKPGGYFIVGSAEQIVDPASFQLDRVSYCIYQKKL